MNAITDNTFTIENSAAELESLNEQFIPRTTTSSLTAVQRADAITQITLARLMIWDAARKNSGLALEDFKCDEGCVNHIEFYLKNVIKPRILKWKQVPSNSIEITRVRTRSGVATSAEKEIQLICKLIKGASMLLGQCIANTFNGQWKFDDKQHIIEVPAAGGVLTFWKCLKFVTLGNEDSPSAFVQSIRHMARNEALVAKVVEQVKRVGKYPARCKEQIWTDADGKLVRIVLFDEDTNSEEFSIEVAQIGAQPQDDMEVK